MTEERELQFHAALLAYGLPCGHCLIQMSSYPNDHNLHECMMFIAHKAKLIDHLFAANYFDVYDNKNATTWVNEFYRWLVEQQEAA